MTNVKVLRLSEVIELTKLAKSSIRERVLKGNFPPSFKLGVNNERSCGFLEHEVNATISAMSAGVSEKELKAIVLKMVEQRKLVAKALLSQIAA